MSSTQHEADVCIVGLGYVGLTLATAFAVADLRVAGVERSPEVVDIISSGRSPFHEFGLEEAISAVAADGRLTAVGLDAPLPAARAYVVTVGTPVRDGDVWLKDLEAAIERIAAGMPEGALVALRSTVRVGTTKGIAERILRASGKDFRLAMVPERTIEGRALAELSSLPQIVGGIDDASTEAAAALFARLGVEIVRVHSAEAAELAKLASNTYRDVQFAFANELAYLSDTMGVDVYDVIHACNYGYDRTNIALPGPVAGPCLEKDAYILADSAILAGTSAPLSMTARHANESIVEHVRAAIGARTVVPATVGIFGIAFKGRPATSDVRGSLAEDFAASFRDGWGAEIVGWDPLVSPTDAQAIGVAWADEAVVASSPVILVQTNHVRFADEQFLDVLVANAPRDAVVVDLWNQLPAAIPGRDDIRVLALGRFGMEAAR